MAQDRYISQQVLQVASPTDTHPHWRTLSKYGQTFFTGLDAGFYFEDLYIGGLIALQYELQEALYPLRAYGSFTKKRTLHGARQVVGSFTINFQQSLLFWLILEHIRQLQTPVPKNQRSLSPSSSAGAVQMNPTGPLTSSAGIKANASNLLIPPALSVYQEIQVQGPKPAVATLTDLSTSLETQDIAGIRARAKQLQTKFNWTQQVQGVVQGPGANLLQSVYDTLLLRPFQSLFDTGSGFTIRIALGDTDKSSFLGVYQSPGQLVVGPQAYSPEYLKMAARVDNSDVALALTELPPSCLIQITGVEISGYGQVFDDSGRPILQTYSFIASDVL